MQGFGHLDLHTSFPKNHLRTLKPLQFASCAVLPCAKIQRVLTFRRFISEQSGHLATCPRWRSTTGNNSPWSCGASQYRHGNPIPRGMGSCRSLLSTMFCKTALLNWNPSRDNTSCNASVAIRSTITEPCCVQRDNLTLNWLQAGKISSSELVEIIRKLRRKCDAFRSIFDDGDSDTEDVTTSNLAQETDN